MRLIFEHIIVNGYVIDVYGDVFSSWFGENYIVHPSRVHITRNGFTVNWDIFKSAGNNEELFWMTLSATEEQYQEYLKGICDGY